MNKLLLISTFLLFSVSAMAQDTTRQQKLTVKGRVIADDPTGFYNLMIVNKATRQGKFGDPSGEFSIKVSQPDTILIAATGYKTKKICFNDSVYRPTYEVTIYLEKLQYELRQVEVFPEREIEEIEEDIQELGYKEEDYRLSGIDAAASPITFLYQMYSKRERSKRKVAQLQNEERKRDLLKELLSKYVEHDIIQLKDEDFDDFIDFCAVPEAIMKNTSQYDFIMYIKKKYELYSAIRNY